MEKEPACGTIQHTETLLASICRGRCENAAI